MSTPGRFIDCKQGSEMWKELRCGLVTASRVKDVIATIKTGEAADRKNYRTELIYERITREPYPQTAEFARQVQWGKEHEGEARMAYELQKDVLVDTIGFVLHPTIERFGASPDGLVDPNGLIQIKCPTTKTHLEWLLAGKIPLDHMPQMLAEMSCTGREWCDFVSFDPRLPEHLQLFVRRFERNEKLIQVIEGEIVHFNEELEQVMRCLPPAPQPAAAILEFPGEQELLN